MLDGVFHGNNTAATFSRLSSTSDARLAGCVQLLEGSGGPRNNEQRVSVTIPERALIRGIPPRPPSECWDRRPAHTNIPIWPPQ